MIDIDKDIIIFKGEDNTILLQNNIYDIQTITLLFDNYHLIVRLTLNNHGIKDIYYYSNKCIMTVIIYLCFLKNEYKLPIIF